MLNLSQDRKDFCAEEYRKQKFVNEELVSLSKMYELRGDYLTKLMNARRLMGERHENFQEAEYAIENYKKAIAFVTSAIDSEEKLAGDNQPVKYKSDSVFNGVI